MEVRPSLLAASDGSRSWCGPTLVGVLAAFAYRPLAASVIQLPANEGFEDWLFRPSALPTPLVLGIGGWLLWRRYPRLLALEARRHTGTTLALAGVGAALFIWALLTRAVDLLLPSLAAHLLALASAARGRPGCRVVVLPSLVLLLGVRLPAPLQDEIVWRLQLWSAAGAEWLLGLAGREFVLAGVVLGDADHTFQVIDACSGLQGIQILILVALLIRELFAFSGRRQWLLVLLAPWLGYALNVVRIAYVATSPDPQALAGATGDHTPQGVAVLAAGTVVLYGLGWALARPLSPGRRPSTLRNAQRAQPWPLAVGWLAALVVLSLALSPFPASRAAAARAELHFPESGSGWTSERLFPDPWFIGSDPNALYRRYERRAERRAPEIVELFVGLDVAHLPETSRLFSSKLNRPGPEWSLERTRRAPLWMLEREADLSVASRAPGSAHAVVYTWRLRDEGPWRESWRSLLSLESSPFRREVPRAVVRLVAFAPHDGQLALDRAKQRLDRFIATFREELSAL
jgi:exosortase